MQKVSSEMTLFDDDGNRLYLSKGERRRFLEAAANEVRKDRIFCHLLHYTGCRPSEALSVTARSVSIDSFEIVFGSLKKRRLGRQGLVMRPQFRSVLVPATLVDQMDLVFDLRRRLRQGQGGENRLWNMSRSTAWRMVKRVMAKAEIVGSQATGKWLRLGLASQCYLVNSRCL